jgi:hypothetical protein
VAVVTTTAELARAADTTAAEAATAATTDADQSGSPMNR